MWESCHFYNIGNLIELSNPQSVDHVFLACDAVVYKNLIRVEGGGGIVSWFGGAIIMQDVPGGGSAGGPVFLYDSSGSTPNSLSGANAGIQFYSAGLEFNDANRGIMNAPDNYNWANVQFFGCELAQGQGEARDSIILNNAKNVSFFGCVLPLALHRIRFKAGTHNFNQTYNCVGQVTLINCMTDGPPSSSAVTYEADAYGQVIGEGCNYPAWADLACRDFHYNWKAAAPGQAVKRKCVNLINNSMLFPVGPSGTADKTILLPEDSTIVGIHAVRNGGGAMSPDYQLSVGTDDRTTVYATSGPAVPQHQVISIHANDLWIDVARDLNSRTVRIWESSGSTGHEYHGGFAVVEYI